MNKLLNQILVLALCSVAFQAHARLQDYMQEDIMTTAVMPADWRETYLTANMDPDQDDLVAFEETIQAKPALQNKTLSATTKPAIVKKPFPGEPKAFIRSVYPTDL